MPKKYSWYVLTFALFILGLSIGFFTGKQLTLDSKTASTETESNEEPNLLFSSQTAFIRGEITKVDGKKLSVVNLTNKQTGDITASDQIVVTKVGQATPSKVDLKSLELNKEVLINLELTNGNFEATSIQYTTPTPSLPPLKQTNGPFN